jgi:hypothetical protein
MGEIHEFEEAHIPEVAALELKVFHQRRGEASPALERYFAEIFFRNPWSDCGLRSLVYLHRGKVVGFVGVLPRLMEFNGRKVLVGVGSQLMIDRDEYRGMAGLALVKRFFAGPQDVSYTDGGTEAAHTVWTAAGAKLARLYSLEWLRVLRPARYLQGQIREHRKAAVRAVARGIFPGCWLADVVLSKLPINYLSPPVTESAAETAGAEDLLQCIQEIGWRDALRPSYELPSFQWLLSEATTAGGRGVLRTVVVREPGGVRIGWFVYYAKAGGVSVALQIGAAPYRMDQVLPALWRDAWERGSVAVRGQAIPRHLLDFSLRHCSFQYLGNGVLLHSRDPQLVACVLQGEAALTRLDGEWWSRFADTDWR